MIDRGILLLQNCRELLELVPSSGREAHLTSYDGNEVISVKVEEGEKEKEPVRITFPPMKAEHEVSCMSMYLLLHTFLKYPELPSSE
jgi:hypothetical protein